jgi:hypothetical protein
MQAETIGLEEAARVLRMAPSTLRKRAAAGIIIGYKPGRRWVFIQGELPAPRAARQLRDPERKARETARWRELRPRRAEYFSWHRASKALRTPSWSNRDAVRAFYVIARRATDCTGIPHAVDHVYPLHGKEVSGLHVPENLRVLPRHLNQSKGNRL